MFLHSTVLLHGMVRYRLGFWIFAHRGELEFGKGGGRASYSSGEDWGIVGFKSRLWVRTREGNSVSSIGPGGHGLGKDSDRPEEGCVRLGEGRVMLGVDGIWGMGGMEWGKDWWGRLGTCSHHTLFVNVYFVWPWRLGHKEHFWSECKKITYIFCYELNRYAQWQPV